MKINRYLFGKINTRVQAVTPSMHRSKLSKLPRRVVKRIHRALHYRTVDMRNAACKMHQKRLTFTVASPTGSFRRTACGENNKALSETCLQEQSTQSKRTTKLELPTNPTCPQLFLVKGNKRSDKLFRFIYKDMHTLGIYKGLDFKA